MKKLIFLIIFYFYFSLSLVSASSMQYSKNKEVRFDSKSGVDIAFSKSPMQNNVMPVSLGAGDWIEIKQNGLVDWLSDPFYLNIRVYCRPKITLKISATPLKEFNIDLGAEEGGSYAEEPKSLNWTNLETWDEKQLNSTDKNSITLKEDDLSEKEIDQNHSRYYTLPFRIQVTTSENNVLQDVYYRADVTVIVTTGE